MPFQKRLPNRITFRCFTRGHLINNFRPNRQIHLQRGKPQQPPQSIKYQDQDLCVDCKKIFDPYEQVIIFFCFFFCFSLYLPLVLVKKTIFFDQAAFWTKHFNFTRGNSHFHTANVAHLIIREKAFCFLCTFLAEGEYIVFFSHKELSAEGNLFASSSASWQCLRYCVTIVCVFASRPSC